MRIQPDIKARIEAKLRARPNYDLHDRIDQLLWLAVLGAGGYFILIGCFL